MIVFKRTDGFAHDLRHEEDGYPLRAGDVMYAPGFGELPEIEDLHDPLTVQQEQDAEEAERLRLQDLRGDALAVELLGRLRTATPTQIHIYVDNQVIDLPSARVMFKRILLVMALLSNGG